MAQSAIVSSLFQRPRVTNNTTNISVKANLVILFSCFLMASNLEAVEGGESPHVDETDDSSDEGDGYFADTIPVGQPSVSNSLNYFVWRDIYPELNVLYENIAILSAEASSIENVGTKP